MKKIIFSLMAPLAIITLAVVFGDTTANAQTPVPATAVQTTYSQPTFCYTWVRNLKIGDKGQDAKALINVLLKERAMNSVPTGSDSEFTESAASAVVAFQEKYASEILTPNGLTHGTGYVGPSTRAKLNRLYGCASTNITPNESPTATAPANNQPTAFVNYQFTKDLTIGDTGADVVALQTTLIALGYDIPLISSRGVAKGYFGPSTSAALGRYQASKGIPATGELDATTRAKLNQTKIGAIDMEVSNQTLSPSVLKKTITLGESINQVFVSNYNNDYSRVTNWFIAKGDMPDGMSLKPYGAFSVQLSGQPTKAGYYGFMISNESHRTYAWVYLNVLSSSLSPITIVSPTSGVNQRNSDGTFSIRWIDSREKGVKQNYIIGLTNNEYGKNSIVEIGADKAGCEFGGVCTFSWNSQYVSSTGNTISMYDVANDPYGNAPAYSNNFTLSNPTQASATPLPIAVGVSLTANLISANEDQAGAWGNFGPGKAYANQNPEDWRWDAVINVPKIMTVKSVSIISNNSGEGWSTSMSTSLLGKSPYPLVPMVLYPDGSTANNAVKAYEQQFTLQSGRNVMKLYGQIESSVWNGGKMIVEFTDGTQAVAYIPTSSIRPSYSSTINVSSAESAVYFISPSSGETLRVGTPKSIQWVGNWGGSDTFTVTKQNNDGSERIVSGVTQAQLGCSGAGKGTCTYSWTPTVATTNAKIVVQRYSGTDGAYSMGTSGTFSVGVNTNEQSYGSLTASCSAGTSNNIVPIAVWSARVSGGKSPYQYSWNVYNDVSNYGEGSTQSSSFMVNYSTAGTKQAVVRVTDALNNSVSVSCSAIVPLSQLSSTPLPQTTVYPTITSVVSSGNPNYQFHPGDRVTIVGSGFNSISYVNWGGGVYGQSIWPTSYTPYNLTFTAPNVNPGTYNIQVMEKVVGAFSNMVNVTVLSMPSSSPAPQTCTTNYSWNGTACVQNQTTTPPPPPPPTSTTVTTQPTPVVVTTVTSGTVSVSSPTGGETFDIGSTVNVRWSTSNYANEHVDLVLRQVNMTSAWGVDSGEQRVRVVNNGSYALRIADINTSQQYILRVLCVPSTACNYADTRPFTIRYAPTNLPPVINSITPATMTLNVGQTGTWTINATDPQGNPLTYIAYYGDGTTYSAPYGNQPYFSSPTFSHSFASPGEYGLSFYAKNSAGLQASKMAVVNVVNPQTVTTQTTVDPTVAFSMVSQSITPNSNSSALTASITFRMTPNGGSVMKPSASDFTLMFLGPSSPITVPVSSITVSPDTAYAANGSEYVVTVTGILQSSNSLVPSTGGSYYMLIKDVDYTIGGMRTNDRAINNLSTYPANISKTTTSSSGTSPSPSPTSNYYQSSLTATANNISDEIWREIGICKALRIYCK